MNLYFIAGDDFDLPIQLFNGDEVLDRNTYEVTSSISGKGFYSECVVTDLPDNKVLLSVSSIDTKTWYEGKAKLDIKVVMNGKVKHSDMFEFIVKKGVTP